MISKRQKNIIDFIIDYESKKGYAPSYDEICQGIGISSKSTVSKHIKSLKDRGLIDTIKGRKRSLFLTEKYINAKVNNTILKKADTTSVYDMQDGRYKYKSLSVPINVSLEEKNTSYNIPLYGCIQAGYPMEAIQVRETISIPNWLNSKHSGELFALKVKGDSMIEDMISDKDIIILKKTEEVSNGKIVAAIIEGYEATLKRYYKLKDGTVKLMPANPAFKPLILKENSVKILGELVGLVRKY
jgi:repressor LexA